MTKPMQRICSNNQGFKSKNLLTVSLPGKVSKSPPPLGGAYLTYSYSGPKQEKKRVKMPPLHPQAQVPDMSGNLAIATRAHNSNDYRNIHL